MKLSVGLALFGIIVPNVVSRALHQQKEASFLSTAIQDEAHLTHTTLASIVPPKDVKTVVHLKEKNTPIYLEGSPLRPDTDKDPEHKAAEDDKLLPNEGHGTEHKEEGHHDEHGGHHEEHHEEGHHEEHGAHEAGHEAEEQESLAIACFLMGTVTALMFLFYLVNHRSIGIRLSTWRVLNMTASIFVAVLLYSSMKMLILHILEPNMLWHVIITLVSFLIFYIGTTAMLYALMGKDDEQLEATATVLAHITGFAAMYGFADAQEIEHIEHLGLTGVVLLIVVASALILSLSQITDKVMKRMSGNDGRVDQAEEKWMEVIDETDDDVFCLAISFLFVLLFRYLIRGEATPYEPGRKLSDVTQPQATALLCVALGFVVLVGAGAVACSKFGQRMNQHKKSKRIVSNIQHLNSMIMAWCFLFWAEWQLYVSGWESTVMGATVVLAFVLTGASFAFVFVLDAIRERLKSNKMAARALSSIELALGVLVGFSWERAFDVGFEEVEHALKHTYHSPIIPAHFVVLLMSTLLLVIVAPAWRYYILPKVAKYEVEMEYGVHCSTHEYSTKSSAIGK
jgi:cation transport ATPase